MKTILIAAGAALALGSAALAQPPSLPDNLAPTRISGTGITVTDLDGMKDWYVTVLGMHVVGTYDREGDVYEYILSTSAERQPGEAVLALLRGRRQEGATTYGRMILNVADADATAEYLNANGVPARRVAAGAYFFSDPEGNQVEIFTPSSQ